MGEQMREDRQAGLQREPYRTPKLTVYGPLAGLTESFGKTGNLDGGGGAKKRSQP